MLPRGKIHNKSFEFRLQIRKLIYDKMTCIMQFEIRFIGNKEYVDSLDEVARATEEQVQLQI